MYVELPDGVCCNIATANKHIGISILRAKYYVSRPSTARLKAKFTTQQQVYDEILCV